MYMTQKKSALTLLTLNTHSLMMPDNAFCLRTLADALNSNRAERNDTSVRNSQLKELYLAKALAVCAPENPLGNGILKEYAESMQGYYVLFADGKLA